MKHALVRPPGDSFPRCISSHPDHYLVDIKLARQQHTDYCRILAELGFEVIELPPDHLLPDSCFVEDTAVIHRNRAFITRMACESRRGEEAAVAEILSEYVRTKAATPPATIEGGDVIHISDRLITGITQRTNLVGVDQMVEWLQVDSKLVNDSGIIHLKSHATYIADGLFITTNAFASHPLFVDFERVVVPPDEQYAANTLTIGSTVLMPAGHMKSISMVKEYGFEVIPINMSEFEKCEGALTCLSLIF
jgi:dimethylargininase